MDDHDAQLMDYLRQDFETTLSARLARYKRADHHPIVANSWFAVASSECVNLFRDGHFYGCISLCQAVGEALVRYMCKQNNFRPARDYEENVRVLKRRGLIDDDFERFCTELWKERNDYHHLNERIETGPQELETLAFGKVRTLARMEGWVFQYTTVADGSIVLKYPKYWPNEGKDVQAHLRL